MPQPKRKKHNYTDDSLLEVVARTKNKEITYSRRNPCCPPQIRYLSINIQKVTTKRKNV